MRNTNRGKSRTALFPAIPRIGQKRAYEQRAPEVQVWLAQEYPEIQARAKRESVNMISAITNQGKVRFRFFEGTMNADVLIDFLMRLVRDATRKVLLILDNLRVHHAKPVKEWLKEHARMIEVFICRRIRRS